MSFISTFQRFNISTPQLLACFFLIISSSLFTQQVSIPEIRKATPVHESAISSPISPVEETGVEPLRSKNAADARFAVAEGFYQRKEYQLACVEFQKFLQLSTPGDLHRDEALFHLAEAYRFLDKSLEAQSTYEQLLKETPSGDVAASAAYRIGEYYHDKKELKKGIKAFEQAAQLSKSATIKNAAHYQQKLCHDELSEQEKATTLFYEASKTTEDQTERLRGLMQLANDDEKCGRSEKALNTYLSISAESPPTVAAEALVKAGVIASQQKNREQALQLFQKAANLKEGDPWNATAALHLMQFDYEAKDYQKVLERSPQALATSNTEECSQALLLAAQAERQLGHFQNALELNDRLLKEFPASGSAHDAAFTRLLLLRSLKDPSLLTQLQDFILTTSDAHQKAQATLLQAEVFFEQENYTPAAKAYATVKDSDLTPTLKADAAYKEAWSLQHLGDATSALGAYTTFLTTYPESPSAPDALIQRAYLEQKQGDLKSALADYDHFLEKYPQALECELVLQQKALAQQAQQDNHGMAATFQQLLSAYPKSTRAAEANYWIGWNLFEEKNYQAAIPFLKKAKLLDAKKFGEKINLRLLLCYYYLEQPELAAREAAELPTNVIPGEVSRWIGLKAYERGDFNQAEQFLNLVMTQNNPNIITREVMIALAETLMKKEKYQAARVPAGKALEQATDPTSRAAALLTLAKIELNLGNDSRAESLTREALLLEPEGRLNVEGRLLIKSILDKSTLKK
ncbi:MAG: tetratricopeptide repeat protein [Verrucomicrobia bacterium]|nr:tetratricopeptide repeat protein [Verrucomicrobiota bacterium]